MALTQMAFTPTTGLRDSTAYPQQPNSETEIRDAIQGQSDQIRDYINDTLLTELESTTESSSGADSIGSYVAGLTGTNVRAQLSELKDQLDSAIEGEISISEIIGAGEITNTMLAADCVDGTKIADDSVDSEHIAAGAIDTEHIGDLQVTETKLATGVVTANKIGLNAVTDSKITASAVTNEKIATSAVTNTKIANGAVTASKLASLGSIPMATGVTVSYSSGKFYLNISGCVSVQLIPAVFGTSSTAPSGTYPAGTVYFQYQA